MSDTKQLVVIGSGPYGLAVAAYAKHLGLDFTLLGPPMGLWRNHMPRGLLLRSPTDWHVDSVGGRSFNDFLEGRGLTPEDVFPIPVELFLEYTDWFTAENKLRTDPRLVKTLNRRDSLFELVLETGETIKASNVVATLGMPYFKHIPDELAKMIPEHQLSHAVDSVNFELLRDKEVLIVGGRMTAFEWAVLMAEQSNAQAHIVHRHETPPFVDSDFSWIWPEVQNTTYVRGWFRNISKSQQKEIDKRFYKEGRLKMEPWLKPRLDAGGVSIQANTAIRSARPGPNGRLDVELDNGTSVTVDHVMLATGYLLDLKRVPYIANGNILDDLRINERSPVLDEDFQSSLPGLYFTGLSAVQDFGPYFGFCVGSPSAGRVIGKSLEKTAGARSS